MTEEEQKILQQIEKTATNNHGCALKDAGDSINDWLQRFYRHCNHMGLSQVLALEYSTAIEGHGKDAEALAAIATEEYKYTAEFGIAVKPVNP